MNLTVELTKEERDCLIDALLIFGSDTDTTEEGRRIAAEILHKI